MDTITSNSVKIKWSKGKSCYEIQGIHVTFTTNSGHNETRNIDKDADWYEMGGLDSNTNFTMKFVTIYAEDSSDPIYISFVTGLLKYHLDHCCTFIIKKLLNNKQLNYFQSQYILYIVLNRFTI